MVDVLVTTAGGIEEDLIKCMGNTYVGDFALKGALALYLLDASRKAAATRCRLPWRHVGSVWGGGRGKGATCHMCALLQTRARAWSHQRHTTRTRCTYVQSIHTHHCAGKELRAQGLNRIGNMLVPNSNYCAFEDWIMPLLDDMLREQQEKGTVWTPSKVCSCTHAMEGRL